ncbi:MAG: hypothetical protein WCP68_10145 [Enhydrobacter sp.]
MDRTSAVELEGMLMAARQPLQTLADHVRENVPGERRREVMIKIATAMAELIDVSRMIYAEFPDLNPHLEEERIALEMKRSIMETKS